MDAPACGLTHSYQRPARSDGSLMSGQLCSALVAHYWRLKMMTRTELCAWLRANSSGDYRPAADAADEIEHLAAAKEQHFAQAMTNGAKAREYRDEAEALRKDALLGRFVRQHLTECHGGWAIAQTFIPGAPSLEDVTDALPAVGAA